MEYTVQQLAKLAGVSARTLRYYDQIGLLCPRRVASSGYRIYGSREVDLLQQILFYRELDVPLAEIAEILRRPGFNHVAALRRHRSQLEQRRNQIDQLLRSLEQAIGCAERGISMQDSQKFEAFKQGLIHQNEGLYGAEIRAAYGDHVVDSAYQKMRGMSAEEYACMQRDEAEVLALLDEAFSQGDPQGETAQRLVQAHRRWLSYSWSEYSSKKHAGLAGLYVADERFARYYDRGVPGKAQFLHDAIHAHIQQA